MLAVRASYRRLGLPLKESKSVVGELVVERLGILRDGARGWLGSAPVRLLDNMALGLTLLSKPWVRKLALQVFLGREVHMLQMRRPLFSIYGQIWQDVARGGSTLRLSMSAVDEMLVALCTMAVRGTSLRAQIHPTATCSDASEQGCGVCRSAGLTPVGSTAVASLRRDPTGGGGDSLQGVLGVAWFDGIGGWRVACEKIGIRFDCFVSCEIDVRCKRCVRAMWPGTIEVGDVTKVNESQIRSWFSVVPNLRGVMQAGGSPCQGLSGLNVAGKGLEDPRSMLFFELVRVVRLVQRVAAG